MTVSGVGVPTRDALLWPTVTALRALGGSGSISEIDERVVEQEAFTPEQQAVLHGDGPKTKIEYRIGWARTSLKIIKLVDNSTRGVWTLTERGRSVDEADVAKLHSEARRALRVERSRRQGEQPSISSPSLGRVEDGDDTDEPDDWKDVLLETVMTMRPDAFERLAQRLLREAGFISVNVTGGSGDGSIDGLGVYRLSLVSFPVFFQCKRYRGSVSSGAVRDFRGAMAGRGDKGLLITTGTFTSDAKKEATRDGAPPVDLIDGDRLCDLLREYKLGVTTEIVQNVIVNSEFFTEI